MELVESKLPLPGSPWATKAAKRSELTRHNQTPVTYENTITPSGFVSCVLKDSHLPTETRTIHF